MTAAEPSNGQDDGRRDFDFLFGSWRVHNRTLRQASGGVGTEWAEFDATIRSRPLLGGLGNIDEFSVPVMPTGEPFEAIALRLFVPATRLWRITWASTGWPGHLDPPVEGRFVDGRGEFSGDDEMDGKPIKIRFEWTGVTTSTPLWRQEFSFDGGRTWEANWIMELSRVS
ncbi:MAG TPA: hypothetical protein VKG85_09850 [Actinomycetes bacterium]|nr:hypothetical protein [Actinomycetes bacterium]